MTRNDTDVRHFLADAHTTLERYRRDWEAENFPSSWQFLVQILLSELRGDPIEPENIRNAGDLHRELKQDPKLQDLLSQGEDALLLLVIANILRHQYLVAAASRKAASPDPDASREQEGKRRVEAFPRGPHPLRTVS